ncbi:MAG: TIGR00180 family glycosyltransferase [Candidatus Kuenenia sp.]|nr:TIGR00180 family glycosyltransferase [Candidatus Kuenenia hertensis]
MTANTMLQEMISILIPTKNRSDFLTRTLLYYVKVNFKGRIYIGDSSNDEHTEKNKHTIEILKDKLKIIYRYFPSPPYMHEGMCVKDLTEIADTPYAVYSGDDDFLIPAGLEKCIDFLENHPDYNAAHGFRINFSLENDDAYSKIISGYIIPGHKLECCVAVERWRTYIQEAFSTQYYVHRTDTWRRMYRDIDSIPIRYFGPEFVPCSLSAIAGKIMQLDCLTAVFQKRHDDTGNWQQLNFYSLITNPEWHSSYKTIKKSITEALVQQDGISNEKADEIFDREFWFHLAFYLYSQYHVKYKASNMPLEEQNKNILYSVLLNPSFRFYSDFRQVYLSVSVPMEINNIYK